MKKSIVIRIPEPCHEDWAKMNATEKGKFCNVCTKEVFDFTSKTDEELVKFLTENKNACGKLKTSQLNREVKLERKSGQSFAPIAASMLLPFTLLSNNPKSSTDSISEKPMISLGIGRLSIPNNLRLQVFTKGIVRDENGNPLKNVEIISNETEARVWTNKNGEYEIYTLDKEILTFTKENYETQVVRLRTNAIENVFMDSGMRTQTSVVGKIVANPDKKIIEKAAAIFTKGTVTDDTGLQLPGVTVIIKGNSTGTQTDFDGNYTIETKPNDVLVFSYVGFVTKEITVSNISNNIDVNLESGAVLGEVVVMAGGISYENYQPRKDEEWKEKVKQASENTRAFEKIKWEAKKEERKAKRQNK